MEMINTWATRKTQIIPLELPAATGTLLTFQTDVYGKDVILFIDNQSVCAALTKGASKSKDIQHLTIAWHAVCVALQ